MLSFFLGFMLGGVLGVIGMAVVQINHHPCNRGD
jgi:hypothetical protein